jgi:thiol-disulfide isomerase/thioredoxin
MALALSLPSVNAQRILEGQVVPNFTIVDHRTGATSRLYDHAGSVVLLNFFAFWCGPARESSPQVQAGISDYFKARGGSAHGFPVKVLSVNIEKNSPERTDEFIATAKLDRVSDDFHAAIHEEFRTDGLPLFVLINGVAGANRRQWEVLDITTGWSPLSLQDWRRLADSILPGSVAAVEPSSETPPKGWEWASSGRREVIFTDLEFARGRWVAVGSEGSLRTSTDGRGWESRTIGTREWIHDVHAAEAMWVAVGDGGLALHSTDGNQWSLAHSATSDALKSVHWANGRWVAVGAGGAIVTSTDGRTWTRIDSPTPHSLYRVAYGAGRWVAVGGSGVVISSVDGRAWVTAASVTDSALFDVAHGGGRWVAVGARDALVSSLDGLRWSFTSQGSSRRLERLVVGDGRWATVGSSGEILGSSTGLEWRRSVVSTGRTFRDVSVANGVWVAVGDGGRLAWSLDGVVWQVPSSTLTPDLRVVRYGEGRWVAAGSDGALISSVAPSGGVTWLPSITSLDIVRDGGRIELRVSGGDPLDLEVSSDLRTWRRLDPGSRAPVGGDPMVSITGGSVLLGPPSGAAMARFFRLPTGLAPLQTVRVDLDSSFSLTPYPGGFQRAQGVAPYQLTQTPREPLRREPVYKDASRVLYGALRLGNSADTLVSFALDRPGTDGSQWVAYVDTNNDEDLTNDGPPLPNSGEKPHDRYPGLVGFAISAACQVEIDAGDRLLNRIFRFWLWTWNSVEVRYYATACYSGTVNLGSTPYAAMAVEWGVPGRADSLYREDGLWLDLNRDGKFDDAEQYFDGDLINLGGERFRLALEYR